MEGGGAEVTHPERIMGLIYMMGLGFKVQSLGFRI